MKCLTGFLLCFCLLSACSKNAAELKTLIVADHQVDCQGEALMKCFLVKERPDQSWQQFYGDIKGFQFEAGFEYEIQVEVIKIANPPADGSSLKYILRRVISKK